MPEKPNHGRKQMFRPVAASVHNVSQQTSAPAGNTVVQQGLEIRPVLHAGSHQTPHST